VFSTVEAAAGDILLLPEHQLCLHVAGCTHIAGIRVSGDGILQISPLEDA
jgi:hypothetical protein